MSAAFWNGIIADHAASQLRATEAVTPATHTFESYVLRGRNEREYPVEVGYQIIRGKVVLTRWCIIGDTWPLTSAELERLDEEAEAHAADLREDEELSLSSASMRGLAA